MPLVRLEVRSEYGSGDPELYARREEPRALFDGVAVAGLVGILRQLGDLAEFAADIFHDLHEQVMATSVRGRKMLTRVKQIEAALPSLEKAIQGQRSHIHFAYVAGSEWHADLRIEQSHILSSDLPQFMMDSYEECWDPPRLNLLDKFDSAGTGACFKRYSDPSYFKRVWAMSELEKAENFQREKKAQKIKRKGSRLNNVEHNTASSSRHFSSTQFASPTIDERSFSTENISAPISDIRLKSEIASGYSSSGSKTRLNYVDPVPDANASVMPDELEYDQLSVSQLQINRSGASASNIHKEPSGISSDDDSQCNSLQRHFHRSSSITWDEKAEISQPTSPKSCDDILVDSVQDSGPLPLSSGLLNRNHRTTDFGTFRQGEAVSDITNAPVMFSGRNHFEEITSETDNYMDALNTLESETETDSEFQTKRELKSRSNYQGMDSGTAKPPEVAVTNSGISEVRSESSENAESPHAFGFAPNSDQHVGNIFSENSAPSMPGMGGSEGIIGEESSESSNHNSDTLLKAGNTPKSHVDTYSIPAIRFWTNASLFGVEPSKPPVFSIPKVSSEDVVSGLNNIEADCLRGMMTTQFHCHGLAATSETEIMSNKSTLKNFTSAEKMDGSPDASISLNDNSSRDQLFGSSGNVVQGSDLSKCSSSCHDNQDENISALQNSQGTVQANSASEYGTMRNLLSADTGDKSGTSDMTESYSVSPRNNLPANYNVQSQTTEADQNVKGISSSFAGLAQRLLSNSFQRKTYNSSDYSTSTGVANADLNPSQESSLLHKHEEGPTGIVLQTYEQNTKEKAERQPSKNSIFSTSPYSGRFSPPLEHMKISFHPMNSLDKTKLKLEFSDGSVHESIENLMFPSFQLHPDSILPVPDSAPESDDDTFCRSCPYSSEDHLSPRSDSNSDLWGQDDRSGSYNHDISDDLTSTTSVSEFKGFQQLNQEDSSTTFGELEADNDRLYFQSGNVADLPGLESFISSEKQQRGDSLSVDPEISAFQSQNEPPPPPLPPVQWRVRLSFAKEHKDSSIAEIVQAERLIAHAQQEQSKPSPPDMTEIIAQPSNKMRRDQKKLNENIEPNHGVNGKQVDKREELLHQIRHKHDQKKLNGHKEVTSNGNDPEERVDLLDQIRNKSFNLRRTTTAKPNLVPQPATNVNVAAILEKANAIRQAFVGSDDGDNDDDDKWSDD